MKRVKFSSRSKSSSDDTTPSFVEVRVLHVWSAAERRDTRHSSFWNSFCKQRILTLQAFVFHFLTALIYLPVKRSLYSQSKMPFENGVFFFSRMFSRPSRTKTFITESFKLYQPNQIVFKKNHHLILSFFLFVFLPPFWSFVQD